MKFPLNIHDTTRSGILMPALSYRFRILFGTDELDQLTQQIVSCESNYVKKETKIVIREPYNHIISTLVLTMCESSIDILVQELDGAGTDILNTVYFSGCVLKNHKVKYDYASSGYVSHVLTFKAANIKIVDEYNEENLYFEDVLILT